MEWIRRRLSQVTRVPKLLSIIAAAVIATTAVAASAIGYYELYHHSNGVSWEIARSCAATEQRSQCIYRWLKRHRSEILTQANRRHVTPLAIAGVIAFESLEDVDPPEVAALARYSGPGKVHYKNWRFWEGEPVSKAVEDRGYLPRQSMSARKRILATSHGAILYIAAILQAYADIAKRQGYSIECRADLLATFYSAWDFGAEKTFLMHHPRNLAPNDIGAWVATETGFLKNAMGVSPSICQQGNVRAADRSLY